MRKAIIKMSVLLCVFSIIFSVSAFALDESITTSNVSVKKGRLFNVEIGIKSNRTLTAAKFTLVYNKDEVDIRKAQSDISGAKVRFNDTKGKTYVIFLCSDGVKCKDYKTLLSVRYKKLTDNNTKIKIKASDCVDGELKNFTPPAFAVCSVKSLTKASSQKFVEKSDLTLSNDDSLEDSIIDDNDDSKDEDEPESRILIGNDDSEFLKFIPLIAFAVIILFAVLLLYSNNRHKNLEEHNKD